MSFQRRIWDTLTVVWRVAKNKKHGVRVFACKSWSVLVHLITWLWTALLHTHISKIVLGLPNYPTEIPKRQLPFSIWTKGKHCFFFKALIKRRLTCSECSRKACSTSSLPDTGTRVYWTWSHWSKVWRILHAHIASHHQQLGPTPSVERETNNHINILDLKVLT